MERDKFKRFDKLKQKSNYEEALKEIDAIILENPNSFDAYYEKAKILSSQKKFESAVRWIGKAINLKEDEPMLYFSRGRWLIQRRLFLDAIKDFTKIIEIENDDVYYLESAYFFRAIALHHVKRYKEVLRDCAEVHDDHVTYVLGEKHSKLGLVEFATAKLVE